MRLTEHCPLVFHYERRLLEVSGSWRWDRIKTQMKILHLGMAKWQDRVKTQTGIISLFLLLKYLFNRTPFWLVCQWLAAGQLFSPSIPVSSTNATDHHDIAEILLKVALKTIPPNNCHYQNGEILMQKDYVKVKVVGIKKLS